MRIHSTLFLVLLANQEFVLGSPLPIAGDGYESTLARRLVVNTIFPKRVPGGVDSVGTGRAERDEVINLVKRPVG
jgi:hypothetical protein